MDLALDTDTCSYIICQRPIEVLSNMRLRAQASDDIHISAVTYAELRLGAERWTNPKKYNLAITLFCECLDSIMAWDKFAADEFAKIQSRLFKAGNPIGNNDAMIARHARYVGAVLVINNQKHFSKVPKLRLENWVLEI